jgi:hypothetical protein
MRIIHAENQKSTSRDEIEALNRPISFRSNFTLYLKLECSPLPLPTSDPRFQFHTLSVCHGLRPRVADRPSAAQSRASTCKVHRWRLCRSRPKCSRAVLREPRHLLRMSRPARHSGRKQTRCGVEAEVSEGSRGLRAQLCEELGKFWDALGCRVSSRA